jgi:hypothetical protein
MLTVTFDSERGGRAMSDIQATIETVLDGWKAGIDNHEPGRVASRFTEDALFQGLRPTHSIGREGVRDYYASQSLGLTADYRILEAWQVAEDTILGYLHVDFGFVDLPTSRRSTRRSSTADNDAEERR